MNTKRVVLLNPNTSADRTEAMLSIARAEAPDFVFEGGTAAFGAPFITNLDEARVGVEAVCAFCDALPDDTADAVILSAFADPGLRERARGFPSRWSALRRPPCWWPPALGATAS